MIASITCVGAWILIIFICLRGEKMRDEYEEVSIKEGKPMAKTIPIFSYEFKKPNIAKRRKCNIDFHNFIIEAQQLEFSDEEDSLEL